VKIADDGTISFRDNERVGVDYLFGTQLFVPFATGTILAHVRLYLTGGKYSGDKCTLTVLRNGQVLDVETILRVFPALGALCYVVCWPSPLIFLMPRAASQQFHWCRGSTDSTRLRPTSSLAVLSSALSQVLRPDRAGAVRRGVWRGCLTWRASSQCLSCMAGTAATGRPRRLRRFSGTTRMVFRPP
jgi:hypothetical protein